MAGTVYLNGDFVESSLAKVSVFDRGFLFGDAIYEVIPVYSGKAFRLTEHIQRLDNSLEAISLNLNYTIEKWTKILEEIIQINGRGHQSIYIQITRGCEKTREHVANQNTLPTVLVMSSPLDVNIAELSPIKVTFLDDIRWQNCFIKTTSLLGNILLKQHASKLGFDEAILHRDRNITEGTTTNVFIVQNKTIFTPKKDQYILAGITRDVIIEISQKASIKVIEKNITLDDVLTADEVWVSSSSREISPVTQIDDKIVAQGDIGPMTKQVHQLFQTFKNQLISA
jgi:D-alanine transaminase